MAAALYRPQFAAARREALGVPSKRNLNSVASRNRVFWPGSAVKLRRNLCSSCFFNGEYSSGGIAGEIGGNKEWETEESVRWLGKSWPRIWQHRGSTLAIMISGEIAAGPHLDSILQDIYLLHGLGIKLILVPATHAKINNLMQQRGIKPSYLDLYRITENDSLEAAMEAAGRIRVMIEAKFSATLPILDLHHQRLKGCDVDLGVCVESGNFLASKRRGVVDGLDFGATGEVKKIDVNRIKRLLDNDCIVIVSSLGYSSSGEVLNCSPYEVAAACALAIGVDKLLCVVDGPILDTSGQRIRFLALRDVDFLVGKLAGFDHGNGLRWSKEGEGRLTRDDGFLPELATAAVVCEGGVPRVHIVDGTVGGALFLELFTGDRAGTVIASSS